ncbi:AGAMOUS-like 42 [Abeliophyllum distichum]|uniref:AGAMOUS-like 42 n=1 Tax=Abeliophyllum distichum TaxID=126358 RepID=A0ABD1VS05_9LAMI
MCRDEPRVNEVRTDQTRITFFPKLLRTRATSRVPENGERKDTNEANRKRIKQTGLIIFSQKGRLFQFSSSNIENTIEKYLEQAKKKETTTDVNTEVQQHVQYLKHETALMAKKIELLESSKRKILGQGLGTYSTEELEDIENQLEKSLKNIRARKTELYKEDIEKLKAKEKYLCKENTRLREKFGIKPRQTPEKEKEIASCGQSSVSVEVVTDLFIGLPPIQNGC